MSFAYKSSSKQLGRKWSEHRRESFVGTKSFLPIFSNHCLSKSFSRRRGKLWKESLSPSGRSVPPELLQPTAAHPGIFYFVVGYTHHTKDTPLHTGLWRTILSVSLHYIWNYKVIIPWNSTLIPPQRVQLLTLGEPDGHARRAHDTSQLPVTWLFWLA